MDAGRRWRAPGHGRLQTAAHHLVLGLLYELTAIALDPRYLSGEVILATFYGAMALPHLLLGTVSLVLGIARLYGSATPGGGAGTGDLSIRPVPVLTVARDRAVIGAAFRF